MRDSLSLAKLPSDIIREIIKLTDLDYFDAVRMVIFLWTSLRKT